MRWIAQVIFHLTFVLNLTLSPVFHLKAYLCCTEPFRKKSDGSHVYCLFLGSNRQYMPICVKMISSWVKKILGVAKTHMSLRCCSVCSFLVDISLCSSYRQSSGPEFLPQPDIIYLPTSLLWIGTTILYSILCWASVSGQLVVVKHRPM